MSKIRSSNTKGELLLRKELWKRGYKYRIVSKLTGKPDIVFNKAKVVVFIDGEFWHGFNWKTKKPKIVANRKYWIQKIEGNMARDGKNNQILLESGWIVLRFWEHEVKKNLSGCADKVESAIRARLG